MNARSMTRTATMVAMALTMTMAAPIVAAAAPGRGAQQRAENKAVSCRPVASYQMSAWVAPMAVVLTSPEAWSQWNREQVAAGRSVGEETLPANVDWTKEVVVVLALGELSESHHVELRGARRWLNETELSLHVETGRGGQCPALVLALERSARRNVKLMADYTLGGVPTTPGTYDAAGAPLASADDDGGLVVVTSWGSLKAEYR
jgi:hypothetical protein